MARYIKANPKVVNYLHLENDRNKVKDGNYILWLQDMMQFGPLPRLAETLERIGAIALLPHEAREEQYGITLRPLPVATDPQFVMETVAETPTGETETQGEATETTEAQGETTETPAEATETQGEGETPAGEESQAPGETETETPESNEESEANEENENPNNEEE